TLDQLKHSLISAIRGAREELRELDPLAGFALATDDEVTTLYHVACSKAWVEENQKQYKEIGDIFVEWQESAADELFRVISKALSEHYENTPSGNFAKARNARFNMLVKALADCRQAGLFDADTLLCVGSTDPGEHMEDLDKKAAYRLNAKPVADRYAKSRCWK
ncbi:MAG TPA: DUF4303 domain-containing protein, partial [Candidatus Methylacidiphilales bacterium]|nr:DUF4303 domain-containing protein [Candidatus Methylacidiphilales bacterium]